MNKKLIYQVLACYGLSCIPSLAQQTGTPVYLNPKEPVEKRIGDLLPRMTLAEKITQVYDDWGCAGIPRLQVPALLKTEGVHGHSYAKGATIYPQAIVMASTFDTTLVKRIGIKTAYEAKAAGAVQSWSPVLDVARDARWGRIEESYGEDPYLVSRMGAAWISGFQGEGLIATPKHFAAHGEPLGGRDSQDVGFSEREMREVHLEPFRVAFRENKTGGVMSAYSTWKGVPASASNELLSGILQQEWKFDGMVVSDCSAIEHLYNKHAIVETLEDAARIGMQSGVNMECGPCYKNVLLNAIKQYKVTEAELDRNVATTLRTKFRLGLFEKKDAPTKVNWNQLPEYRSAEALALAKETSVKGSVLLVNKNNILPLSKSLKKIAVIGPAADLGYTGGYSGQLIDGQLVTVLQGIRNKVGGQTEILYAKGCEITGDSETGIDEAVAAARQAEVVIIVAGDNNSTVGENKDGSTLEFPGKQKELIRAIGVLGKPVVLVPLVGKPVLLEWESQNLDAILLGWFPGEQGGNGIADLLFGDAVPSGRLPISFPVSAGQCPVFYNYKTSGRNYDYYDGTGAPLFRFGYGLSYTQFRYSNLQCEPEPGNSGYVHIRVDVENIGPVTADEVAQLYLTDAVASIQTAVIQMKRFARVTLNPGEKKTLVFDLTPDDMALYDGNLHRVTEPGLFRVHIGGTSPQMPKGNSEHKKKIGFTNNIEGISGSFTVTETYRADMEVALSYPKLEETRNDITGALRDETPDIGAYEYSKPNTGTKSKQDDRLQVWIYDNILYFKGGNIPQFVSLYDTQGILQLSEKVSDTTGQINLSGLQKGVYIVSLHFADRSSQKIKLCK